MKKYYLVLIVLQAFSFGLFAQQSSDSYTVLTRSTDGTPTLIQFNENSTVTHENFKNELISEFSFREEDSFHLVSNKADKLGFVHYKFNQTYKGIVVFGIQYILHEKAGRLIRANGKFIPNLNIDTIATISKDNAVKFAMIDIGLKKYRWEDEKWESSIKKRAKNENASYYPKPELVITPVGGNYNKGKFRLCWKFNVAGVTLENAWTVFVDAKTGEVINKISLVSNDTPATGTGHYYGTLNMMCTDDTGGSGYYLLNESQRGTGMSQYIYTTTANNDSLPSSGGNIWNTAQYIGSLTTSFTGDPVANNVHWGIENAYDFFQVFGRNSFDDAGKYIWNFVHYGSPTFNNAFWSSYDTVMCYGDGDGINYDAFVSLDITGHEFSHAITNYSAELIYESESGALNESFSDIFGRGIEWYVFGATSDWTIGEDITLTAPFARSMSSPHAAQQPDTYGINDSYWFDVNGCTPVDANDKCGVHINSGVQNYWFYLLANGGSGTNANGFSYSVTGIGMSDALNIVYRNLTSNLTPTSDYSDAVSGSISSAIDFWGAGSQQVQSTIDAWCAVGLGMCGSAPVASFSANNTNICAGTCISFTDQSTNTPTIWSWSFPNGNPSSSTSQNPTNICYAAAGTYSVTLTATNLTGSNTFTSTNYITVNANSIAPTGANASVSTVCSGSSTTLSVVGGTLGTGASWRWHSGSCTGTLVGTGSSITVSPVATTTYYVSAEGNCNTTSCASVTIALNTQSVAALSISANPNSVTLGNSTTLSLSGGSLGTGAVWTWYAGICGGTIIGTGDSISFSPTGTNTYYVGAVGTCNNTSCESVVVQVVITGIEEANNLSRFFLFPNPTQSSFTLKNISSTENFQLQIFNPLGEIVYTEKLFGKNEYVVNANFAKGVYFVRVNDVLRKLVVE